MAPPFNINNTSPADNALVSAFPNDERANRTLIEEWLSWISDPTTGDIRESVLPPAASVIPTGTKMLFVQTAAPTGFTKDVTHNNKALRIVNGAAGTGGTTGFTSVFATRTPAGTLDSVAQGGSISSVQVTGSTDNATSTGTVGNTTSTGTVGGTALTEANLPSHTHGAGSLTITGSTNVTGAHVHSITRASVTGTAGQAVYSNNDEGLGADSTGISASGDHSHTVSGTVNGGATGATGSGTTHTHSLTMNAHNHSLTMNAHAHSFTSNTHNHTFTGNSHNHTFTGTGMDFNVQYVDVIIATKD